MLPSRLSRPTPRFRAASLGIVCISALVLAGATALNGPAAEARALQTFGPGTVDCQPLAAMQSDCLLSASRISGNNNNEATFNITALPPGERASFGKWCGKPSDHCQVTITGTRQAPTASRLSAITAIRWTRPNKPMNQAAARALPN
jgi:hypothetical protein